MLIQNSGREAYGAPVTDGLSNYLLKLLEVERFISMSFSQI